jgi:small subunit ribosomal protein S1
VDEEKEAMATFGSTDSGASLGDILGAAMTKRATKDEPAAADAADDDAGKAKRKKKPTADESE